MKEELQKEFEAELRPLLDSKTDKEVLQWLLEKYAMSARMPDNRKMHELWVWLREDFEKRLTTKDKQLETYNNQINDLILERRKLADESNAKDKQIKEAIEERIKTIEQSNTYQNATTKEYFTLPTSSVKMLKALLTKLKE